MKTKLRFMALVLLGIMLSVNQVWGDVITINCADFGTTYSNLEVTFTKNTSYTMGYWNIIQNNTSNPSNWYQKQLMQCKKNATQYARLYNKTSLPGLSKIRFYVVSGITFQVYTGTSMIDDTPSSGAKTLGSKAGTLTGVQYTTYVSKKQGTGTIDIDYYDIDITNGDTYFYFTTGNIVTAYIYRIEVTYASTKTAVKYDANGKTLKSGSTLPDDVSADAGKDYTVSTATVEADGYTFKGWNTDKNATVGIETVPAASMVANETVTLYAIWEEVAAKTITSISITTAPKTSYTTCETLVVSDWKVTATYSDKTQGDVTSACVFSPANGSTFSSTGEQTVTATHNTFATPAYKTISVTQGARDTFQDDMHGKATQYGDCDGYTIPSLDDETKGTECVGEHYKFIGWSSSAISSGTYTEEPQGLLKAGATHNATGATYHAVWAKEKTE